MDGLHAATD